VIIDYSKPGKFGSNYRITERLHVSRNNPKEYGLGEGRYYIELDGRHTALSDENMQELFMAYQAMRKEYETGEDINYDENP
jgi:hypothetical protein